MQSGLNLLVASKKKNRFSNEDTFHDLAVDVGQAVVTALEAIGQAFMIDPQTVKNCGLQIMHVNRIFHDVE